MPGLADVAARVDTGGEILALVPILVASVVAVGMIVFDGRGSTVRAASALIDVDLQVITAAVDKDFVVVNRSGWLPRGVTLPARGSRPSPAAGMFMDVDLGSITGGININLFVPLFTGPG